MKEYCCDIFPKIARSFDWLKREDSNKNHVFCMPHIVSDGIMYRVNNCPSCGKEIRSIEIQIEKYRFL